MNTRREAPRPTPTSDVTNPYRRALRAMRPALLAATGFSAIINILMLTGSIYMLQVYDRVLASGSVATLLGLFAIVVVLYAFLGFYDFLRARLLGRAALRLDQAVGPEAFVLSIGGADRPGAGATARPLRDLATVRGFFSSPAVSGLMDAPWVPVYLLILWLLHPWLGMLTLGGAAVITVIAWANRRMTRGPIERAMTHDAVERDFTEQGRQGAEAIRAMGMTGKVTEAWSRLNRTTLAAQQEGSDPAEVMTSASKAFRLLLQSAILTLGAYLVLQHEMSAGMIVASSILSGRALAPVDQVIGQWRAIGRAIEANRRLKETFADHAADRGRIQLPDPTGAITATRLLKFAPARPGADRQRIVDQVSFELSPGDGLGVIGTSAAGKSSLARLLVGVWAPDSGEIRLDGATPDQWHPEDLGRHVGYLPQQVHLLPGTIRENIARFDPEADDEAVIEAAKLTGVHEMILALADGYATRVGNGDMPLSGGQVQRLGLTRAIYGFPKIIVLDEPNSNLDADGDEALARTILDLRRRGSTVIVMAHRPSAIASVNKVMVLQKGAVVRFGDKEEVLAATLQKVPSANPAATATRPGTMAGPATGAPGGPGRTAPQTAMRRTAPAASSAANSAAGYEPEHEESGHNAPDARAGLDPARLAQIRGGRSAGSADLPTPANLPRDRSLG